MPAVDLTPGATYAVIHRSGRQKHNRRSVMRLLGSERRAGQTATLIFDARPVAGTQRFSLECIIDLRKVKPSTPIVMNEVLK